MRATAVGCCVGLMLLTGCSEVAQQDAAAAAVAFVQASPAQECGLMAPDTAESLETDPGTDCATALSRLDMPTSADVQRVEVAVESAQVQFVDQVLFLAHFPDGWRVTAAGCVRDDPDPAVPYQCKVKP